MKQILLLFLAIFMGAGGSLAAQYTPIPTLQAPMAGFSFPVKETLSFDVDWRVFTAGTAVFHLEQVPGGDDEDYGDSGYGRRDEYAVSGC